MRRIKSKDTKPEKTVRSIAHSLGLRFRLHDKSLPGSPDLVFKRYKRIIFVHGCFWHNHDSQICKRNHISKTNKKYWSEKIEKNQERDKKILEILLSMGWFVLVIWECETSDCEKIKAKLQSFFDQ